MTHNERIVAARAYYERATVEKAELAGLRDRIASIRQAVDSITGVPTLAKLAAFLSAVRQILEVT